MGIGWNMMPSNPKSLGDAMQGYVPGGSLALGGVVSDVPGCAKIHSLLGGIVFLRVRTTV